MPIKVICNKCGTTYGLKEELIGKKCKCPKCDNIINICENEPEKKTISIYIRQAIILILLGLIGFFLGYIASKINDLTWYIIIFPAILGIIGGIIYNIILKLLTITKKQKIFIYIGISLCTLITFFSINSFDYYQYNNNYNKVITGKINSTKDNNQKILLSMYKEQLKILKQINIEQYKEGKTLNILLSIVGKNIDNNNYNKVIENFIIYFQKVEKATGEDYSKIYSNLKIIKENLNIKKIDYSFESLLEKETGYKGYLGFQLFSFKNGSRLETDTGSIINTGLIGGILLFILDIISFIYGMTIPLNILNKNFCKKHKKYFITFGEEYTFPTTLKNFKSLEFDDILKSINNKPNKIYYFSMNFLQCPICKNDGNIEVICSNHGKLKEKPLTGVKTVAFIIKKEKFIEINETIKKINETMHIN